MKRGIFISMIMMGVSMANAGAQSQPVYQADPGRQQELVAIPQSGQVQYQPMNPNDSYIEVTGKSVRKVTPDRIYLSISISEKDFRNRDLVSLEKDMIRALKKVGIDVEKDLKVSDMSSNFRKYWYGRQDVRVSRDYQLLTRDASTAGKAIMALEEMGISNVNLEKAEYSGIEKLKLEVKVEAVKAAREKALMMTEAIGQTLGPAFYISDQESYRGSYRSNRILAKSAIMSADGAMEESLPELEFEEMDVESTVVVRFRLP